MQPTNTTKINLLEFSRSELEKFFTDLGEKSFRGTQVFKWVHQLGQTDFATMTNLSLALRQHLIDNTEVRLPEITTTLVSKDGARKWLLKLADNNYIETVLIPEADRGTLCVSSQVGCQVNCDFCATGKLGFKRNLTLSEIIGQLWIANRELSPDKTSRHHVITNVVFMGMGEPLLNFENVVKAAEIMLDNNAYGLSKFRVTVSTCGITPEILRLKEVSKVSLAISLHASNDKLRNKLMPINKKYPIAELISAAKIYFKDEPKRAVTIEYIMLDGINDSVSHAHELAKLLRGAYFKVNLIPGNFISGSSYKSSAQSTIDAFRDVLLASGINTITRKSRGSDIAAACGQLVAEKLVSSV